MLFSRILVALAAVGVAIAAPAALPESNARVTNLNYGDDKLRGVNIGGWLVLEPWITPSIFQNVDQSLGITDEFSLCQKLPYNAPSILRNHWDTWATYNDFAKIKAAGFNVVRIPIGFWAFDNTDTPFVKGAADYLNAAIEWSRQLGLQVIIDLHGAPGSQNGFDNSGQVMESPRWMEDGGFQGGSSQRTLDIISTISQRYAKSDYDDVVLAIELVNEPRGWTDATSQDDLHKFYAEGYNRVRHYGNTTVVMHDAFLHPASYNKFMTPEAPIMDHHYYQVFDDGILYMKPQQHRQYACESATLYQNADKPVIIGEWSGAMTDCTPHLNGYNKGNRYEGTWPDSTFHGKCPRNHDIKTWSQQMRDDTRAFIEAQMNTFEQNTLGWVWWNFKTECAAEWDALLLIDEGVFPNPVWDRKVENACGY